MPVTKRINSYLARVSDLCVECLFATEIVEAELSRQNRLLMAREQRSRSGNLMPFRESLTPELVVFWNGVELPQVVSDGCNGLRHISNRFKRNGKSTRSLAKLFRHSLGRAGQPTAMQPGAILPMTTELAPITAPSPITAPGVTTTPSPIHTLFP